MAGRHHKQEDIEWHSTATSSEAEYGVQYSPQMVRYSLDCCRWSYYVMTFQGNCRITWTPEYTVGVFRITSTIQPS